MPIGSHEHETHKIDYWLSALFDQNHKLFWYFTEDDQFDGLKPLWIHSVQSNNQWALSDSHSKSTQTTLDGKMLEAKNFATSPDWALMCNSNFAYWIMMEICMLILQL